MQITPIPAFSDNYLWLIHSPDSPRAAIVDPGDARPVIDTLQTLGLELGAILITHKHSDHIGGIADLLQKYPGIPVYGPSNEPIPALTVRLSEGDQVNLPWLNIKFQVFDTPGHTEGHIAYFNDQADVPVLFCGDTMFSVGCGRVFSGTFEQLHDSLHRLAELPANTQVYCAHEYTLDNIGFAEWVEPENTELADYKQECLDILDAGGATVPFQLAKQLQINPFLRVKHPLVVNAANQHAQRMLINSRSVFRELRTWKDREYD